MVRPERRVVPVGASPVRVSVRAPGSRPQLKAAMPPARAGRRKPLKKKGANKRAVTLRQCCSLDKLSAGRCLGGPSRSCHGEGYLRTGNADRKFNQLDSYVYERLTIRRRAEQRAGRVDKWTHDRFVAMGLYRLRGTVRYPAQKPHGEHHRHARFERGLLKTGWW